MANAFSSKLSIDALMMTLQMRFHFRLQSKRTGILEPPRSVPSLVVKQAPEHMGSKNENEPEDFALNNNQGHMSGHLCQELFHANSCIHMSQSYCDKFPFRFSQLIQIRKKLTDINFCGW